MNIILALQRTLLVLLLLPAITLAADQPKEILLWPNGAPGAEGKPKEEAVRVTPDGEHVVSNVHYPSLTPYLPAKTKASLTAVIIAPGGGHRELWVDHEGHNFARWWIRNARSASCAAAPRNGASLRRGSASSVFRPGENWRPSPNGRRDSKSG